MPFQHRGFQPNALNVENTRVKIAGYSDGATAGDVYDHAQILGTVIAEAAAALDGPQQPFVAQRWQASAAAGGASVAVTINPAHADSTILVLASLGDETGGSVVISSVSGSTLGAFTQRGVQADFPALFTAYAYTKALSGPLSGETITATWGNTSGFKQITVLEIVGYGGVGSTVIWTDNQGPTWATPTATGGANGWTAGGWSNGSLVFAVMAAQETPGSLTATTANGNSTKLSEFIAANAHAQVGVFQLVGFSTTTIVSVGASDSKNNLAGLGIEILAGTPPVDGGGQASLSQGNVYAEGPIAGADFTAKGRPDRVNMVEGALAGDNYDASVTSPSAGQIYEEGALAGESETAVLVIPAALAEGPIAAEVEASFQKSVDAYLEGDVLTEAETGGLLIPLAYSDGAAAFDQYTLGLSALATYAEGPTAIDQYASFQKSVDGYLDGALAASAETGALLIPVAYADGALAGDQYTALLTLATAYTDGATAAEQYAALQRGASSYADGAVAGDTYTALLILAAAYVDGALAGDAYTARLILTAAYSDGDVLTDFYAGEKPGAATGAYSEGAVAAEAVDATQRLPVAFAEGALAAEQESGGLIIQLAYSDGAAAGDQYTLALIATSAYAEGALAVDGAASLQRHAGAYADACSAADQYAATLRIAAAYADGASALDAYERVIPAGGAAFSESALALDAFAAHQLSAARYVDGATALDSEAALRAQIAPPSRGLYAPRAIPTYVPTLMLSLGRQAQQSVIAACGGAGTVLESPSALGIGAPWHPARPEDGRSIWQYEGDLYAAALFYGVRIMPGATYLAVTSNLVRARLVNPGPVTYFALPDLSPSTVLPLVAAMNFLTLNPPPGPLPPGRAPWRDPAGKYGFATPTTSAFVGTMMASLDRAAQREVVLATGGPAAILTTPMPLLGAAPADPLTDHGYSYWQYEGALYRAAARDGLKLRPGALYLGIKHRVVAARLVDPGPVAWLGLPNLLPGTVDPLVASMNALVP